MQGTAVLGFRVCVGTQGFGGASLLTLHGHRAAGRGLAQKSWGGLPALVQPGQISLQMNRRKISFLAVGRKSLQEFQG